MHKRKRNTVLIRMQLWQAVLSPRVLVGYVYSLWMGISIGMRYTAFSSGMQTGIFDAFILLSNERFQVTLLMIGFLIVIADAPFVDSRTYYVLIRSSGSKWRHSMTVYIALQVFIYEGIALLGSMIPGVIGGNSGTLNEWSEVLQIMQNAMPEIAVSKYDLPIIGNGILKSFSAVQALFHSFVLNSAYLFLLGLVIFVGNLNSRLPLGNIIAVGLHLVGMLVVSDFVPLYKPSLVAHGILTFHTDHGPLSLTESYLVFAIWYIILMIILQNMSKYIDYNTAVSQKTW